MIQPNRAQALVLLTLVLAPLALAFAEPTAKLKPHPEALPNTHPPGDVDQLGPRPVHRGRPGDAGRHRGRRDGRNAWWEPGNTPRIRPLRGTRLPS